MIYQVVLVAVTLVGCLLVVTQAHQVFLVKVIKGEIMVQAVQTMQVVVVVKALLV
jgi:hypothetical protein